MNSQNSHSSLLPSIVQYRVPVKKVVAALVVPIFLLQQAAFAAPSLPKFSLFSDKQPKVHFKLPYSVAYIEDGYKAEKGDKLLFLVQDAHTNESGQINIAKALELIISKEGIGHVFLEAGQGDVSLSFLRDFASESKRKRVAMSFLRKGLLQGSEFLDITSDLDFKLWGVEDQGLYEQAIEAYRYIVAHRETYTRYLAKIDSTLKIIKSDVLNDDLERVYDLHQEHQNGSVSLTDYFEALTNEAERQNIPINDFPSLNKLKNIRKAEASVDFQKANAEQAQALTSLAPEDQQLLAQASRDLRNPFKYSLKGQEESKAYYALLQDKLGSLNGYPNLKRYLAYLKKARDLDAGEVLTEQKRLELRVYRKLTRTEDESTFVQVAQHLRTLDNLFNLTATPDDLSALNRDRRLYDIAYLTGFLNIKIMELEKHYDKVVFLDEGFKQAIAKAEAFYELTHGRDRAFIKNAFKEMDANGERKAILITGGYHTPNLKELLKSQNTSFVSITPQILHPTNHERYEKLLLSQVLSTDEDDYSKQNRKYARNMVALNNASVRPLVTDARHARQFVLSSLARLVESLAGDEAVKAAWQELEDRKATRVRRSGGTGGTQAGVGAGLGRPPVIVPPVVAASRATEDELIEPTSEANIAAHLNAFSHTQVAANQTHSHSHIHGARGDHGHDHAHPSVVTPTGARTPVDVLGSEISEWTLRDLEILLRPTPGSEMAFTVSASDISEGDTESLSSDVKATHTPSGLEKSFQLILTVEPVEEPDETQSGIDTIHVSTLSLDGRTIIGPVTDEDLALTEFANMHLIGEYLRDYIRSQGARGSLRREGDAVELDVRSAPAEISVSVYPDLTLRQTDKGLFVHGKFETTFGLDDIAAGPITDGVEDSVSIGEGVYVIFLRNRQGKGSLVVTQESMTNVVIPGKTLQATLLMSSSAPGRIRVSVFRNRDDIRFPFYGIVKQPREAADPERFAVLPHVDLLDQSIELILQEHRDYTVANHMRQRLTQGWLNHPQGWLQIQTIGELTAMSAADLRVIEGFDIPEISLLRSSINALRNSTNDPRLHLAGEAPTGARTVNLDQAREYKTQLFNDRFWNDAEKRTVDPAVVEIPRDAHPLVPIVSLIGDAEQVPAKGLILAPFHEVALMNDPTQGPEILAESRDIAISVNDVLQDAYSVDIAYVIWPGMGGSIEDKNAAIAAGLASNDVRFFGLDDVNPETLGNVYQQIIELEAKATNLDPVRDREEILESALERTVVFGQALGMTSVEPVFNIQQALGPTFKEFSLKMENHFYKITIPGSLLDQGLQAPVQNITHQVSGMSTAAGRHDYISDGLLVPLAILGGDVTRWAEALDISDPDVQQALNLANWIVDNEAEGRNKIVLGLPEEWQSRFEDGEWREVALWIKQHFEESLGKDPSKVLKVVTTRAVKAKEFDEVKDTTDKTFLVIKIRGMKNISDKEIKKLRDKGYKVRVIDLDDKTAKEQGPYSLARVMQMMTYAKYSVAEQWGFTAVNQPPVEFYKKLVSFMRESDENYRLVQDLFNNSGHSVTDEATGITLNYTALIANNSITEREITNELRDLGLDPNSPADVAGVIHRIALRKLGPRAYGEVMYSGNLTRGPAAQKMRETLNQSVARDLWQIALKSHADVGKGPGAGHATHAMGKQGQVITTNILPNKHKDTDPLVANYETDYQAQNWLANVMALAGYDVVDGQLVLNGHPGIALLLSIPENTGKSRKAIQRYNRRIAEIIEMDQTEVAGARVVLEPEGWSEIKLGPNQQMFLEIDQAWYSISRGEDSGLELTFPGTNAWQGYKGKAYEPAVVSLGGTSNIRLSSSSTAELIFNQRTHTDVPFPTFSQLSDAITLFRNFSSNPDTIPFRIANTTNATISIRVTDTTQGVVGARSVADWIRYIDQYAPFVPFSQRQGRIDEARAFLAAEQANLGDDAAHLETAINNSQQLLAEILERSSGINYFGDHIRSSMLRSPVIVFGAGRLVRGLGGEIISENNLGEAVLIQPAGVDSVHMMRDPARNDGTYDIDIGRNEGIETLTVSGFTGSVTLEDDRAMQEVIDMMQDYNHKHPVILHAITDGAFKRDQNGHPQPVFHQVMQMLYAYFYGHQGKPGFESAHINLVNTDNYRGNGAEIKKQVLEALALSSDTTLAKDRFADWMEEHVTFHEVVPDRITGFRQARPGSPGGHEQANPSIPETEAIPTDPAFGLLIYDPKGTMPVAWRSATGVIVTDNEEEFELLHDYKLLMANATHTLMVYMAALMGVEHTRDAIRTDERTIFEEILDTYIQADVIPALRQRTMDVYEISAEEADAKIWAYYEQWRERLRNPYIDHVNLWIAQGATGKIELRFGQTITAKNGDVHDILQLAIATILRHLTPMGVQPAPIEGQQPTFAGQFDTGVDVGEQRSYVPGLTYEGNSFLFRDPNPEIPRALLRVRLALENNDVAQALEMLTTDVLAQISWESTGARHTLADYPDLADGIIDYYLAIQEGASVESLVQSMRQPQFIREQHMRNAQRSRVFTRAIQPILDSPLSIQALAAAQVVVLVPFNAEASNVRVLVRSLRSALPEVMDELGIGEKGQGQATVVVSSEARVADLMHGRGIQPLVGYNERAKLLPVVKPAEFRGKAPSELIGLHMANMANNGEGAIYVVVDADVRVNFGTASAKSLLTALLGPIAQRAKGAKREADISQLRSAYRLFEEDDKLIQIWTQAITQGANLIQQGGGDSYGGERAYSPQMVRWILQNQRLLPLTDAHQEVYDIGQHVMVTRGAYTDTELRITPMVSKWHAQVDHAEHILPRQPLVVDKVFRDVIANRHLMRGRTRSRVNVSTDAAKRQKVARNPDLKNLTVAEVLPDDYRRWLLTTYRERLTGNGVETVTARVLKKIFGSTRFDNEIMGYAQMQGDAAFEVKFSPDDMADATVRMIELFEQAENESDREGIVEAYVTLQLLSTLDYANKAHGHPSGKWMEAAPPLDELYAQAYEIAFDAYYARTVVTPTGARATAKTSAASVFGVFRRSTVKAKHGAGLTRAEIAANKTLDYKGSEKGLQNALNTLVALGIIRKVGTDDETAKYTLPAEARDKRKVLATFLDENFGRGTPITSAQIEALLPMIDALIPHQRQRQHIGILDESKNLEALREIEARIAEAQAFAKRERNSLSTKEREALSKAIQRAKYQLKKKSKTQVLVVDPTGALTGKTVTPQAGTDLVPVRTDAQMQPLWDRLEWAEEQGLHPQTIGALRQIAFGGGLDNPAYKRGGPPSPEEYLEDHPSLILIPGGTNVRTEISLARDEDGNHLPNHIQYDIPQLGVSDSVQVPLELEWNAQRELWETPNGMYQAAAHFLGNLSGLRGIRFTVHFDDALPVQTGGFESSDTGRRTVAQYRMDLERFLGDADPITLGNAIADARAFAKTHWKDYTAGGQGMFGLLGMGRTYFVDGLIGPDGSPLPLGTAFIKRYSPQERDEIAQYLSSVTMVANAGAWFLRGQRDGERFAQFTSGMMVDLKELGHPMTLSEMAQMRHLVTKIDQALRTKDTDLLVASHGQYTDLRVGFQARWLQFALEAKGKPGHEFYSFYQKAQADPFLKSLLRRIEREKITDLRTVAPYLGGHWITVQKARTHQVAYNPGGAGGYHANGIWIGRPANLRAFSEAMGWEPITTQSYANLLAESQRGAQGKRVRLEGIIPSEIMRSEAFTVNDDYRVVFGLDDVSLPVAEVDQVPGTIELVTGARQVSGSRIVGKLPDLTADQLASIDRSRTVHAEVAGLWTPADETQLQQAMKVFQIAKPSDPPISVESDENPEGRFLLSGRLTPELLRETRGVTFLSEIEQRRSYKGIAANSRLILGDLLGGLGKRLLTDRMSAVVQRLEGKTGPVPANLTKAMRVGRFEQVDGKWKFVRVTEMVLEGMAQAQANQKVAQVSYLPLISQGGDINVDYVTQFSAGSPVQVETAHVQGRLPPLNDKGEVVLDTNVSYEPGGTIAWAYDLLGWVRTLDLDDSQPTIIMVKNGEFPNLPPLSMIEELLGNTEVAAIQAEIVTTASTRENTSRTGLIRRPSGLFVPGILEPRQIKAHPSAELIQDSGVTFGQGLQTTNGNMFLLHANRLKAIEDKLAEIVGEAHLADILTGEPIYRGGEQIQIDSAFNAPLHSLQAYLLGDYLSDEGLSGEQRQRIHNELPRSMLLFVPVNANEIFRVNIPIKNMPDAWYLMTSRYARDEATRVLVDQNPEAPRAVFSFDTQDGRYADPDGDLYNYVADFGLADTRELTYFSVTGTTGIKLTEGNFDRTDDGRELNLTTNDLDLRDDLVLRGRVEIVTETTNQPTFTLRNITATDEQQLGLGINASELVLEDVRITFKDGATGFDVSIEPLGARQTTWSRTQLTENLDTVHDAFRPQARQKSIREAITAGRRILKAGKDSKEAIYLYTELSSAKFAGGYREERAEEIAKALGIKTRLQKSRVMVTGGTSYLARKMIEKLIQEGHQVVVLAPSLEEGELMDDQIRAGRERLEIYANDPRIDVIDYDYTRPTGFDLTDAFGDVNLEEMIETVYRFPVVTSRSQVENGLGTYALREVAYGLDNIQQFAKLVGASMVNVGSNRSYGDSDHPDARLALEEIGGAPQGLIPETFKGYSNQTDILAEQHKAAEVWHASIAAAEGVDARMVRVGFVLGEDMQASDIDAGTPLADILIARQKLSDLLAQRALTTKKFELRAIDAEIKALEFKLDRYEDKVNIADVRDVTAGIYAAAQHEFAQPMNYNGDNTDRVFNLANTSQTTTDGIANAVRNSLEGQPSKLKETQVAAWRNKQSKRTPGYKAPEYVRLSTERSQSELGFTHENQGGLFLFRKLLAKFGKAGLSPPAVDVSIVSESLVDVNADPILVELTNDALAETQEFSLDSPDQMNPDFVIDENKEVIVILGGAGFLGLNLALQYALNGYQVVIIDNFAAGLSANLQAVLDSNEVELAPNIAAFNYNAALPFTFDENTPIAQVMHAASLASPAFYFADQRGTSHTGVNINEQAAELARKFSVLRETNVTHLAFGTSEEYGDAMVNPQPEDYLGHVSPTGPRSMYDVNAKRLLKTQAVYEDSGRYPSLIENTRTSRLTKDEAEELRDRLNQHSENTQGYARYIAKRQEGVEGRRAWMVTEAPVDTRVVRISNTFGPFMRIDDGRVVTNFIKFGLDQALHELGLRSEPGQGLTIHGLGEQNRSFLWVGNWDSDQVRALRVMADPSTKFEGNDIEAKTLNSGADNPKLATLTMNELAVMIAQQIRGIVDTPADFEVTIHHTSWNEVLVGTVGPNVGTILPEAVESKEEAERIRDEMNASVGDPNRYIIYPDNNDHSKWMVVSRDYRGSDDPQQRLLDTTRIQQVLGHPVTTTPPSLAFRKLILYYLGMPPITLAAPDEETQEMITRTYDYTQLPVRKEFILGMFTDPIASETLSRHEALTLVRKFYEHTYMDAPAADREGLTKELVQAIKSSDSNIKPQRRKDALALVEELGMLGSRVILAGVPIEGIRQVVDLNGVEDLSEATRARINQLLTRVTKASPRTESQDIETISGMLEMIRTHLTMDAIQLPSKPKVGERILAQILGRTIRLAETFAGFEGIELYTDKSSPIKGWVAEILETVFFEGETDGRGAPDVSTSATVTPVLRNSIVRNGIINAIGLEVLSRSDEGVSGARAAWSTELTTDEIRHMRTVFQKIQNQALGDTKGLSLENIQAQTNLTRQQVTAAIDHLIEMGVLKHAQYEDVDKETLLRHLQGDMSVERYFLADELRGDQSAKKDARGQVLEAFKQSLQRSKAAEAKRNKYRLERAINTAKGNLATPQEAFLKASIDVFTANDANRFERIDTLLRASRYESIGFRGGATGTVIAPRDMKMPNVSEGDILVRMMPNGEHEIFRVVGFRDYRFGKDPRKKTNPKHHHIELVNSRGETVAWERGGSDDTHWAFINAYRKLKADNPVQRRRRISIEKPTATDRNKAKQARVMLTEHGQIKIPTASERRRFGIQRPTQLKRTFAYISHGPTFANGQHNFHGSDRDGPLSRVTTYLDDALKNGVLTARRAAKHLFDQLEISLDGKTGQGLYSKVVELLKSGKIAFVVSEMMRTQETYRETHNIALGAPPVADADGNIIAEGVFGRYPGLSAVDLPNPEDVPAVPWMLEIKFGINHYRVHRPSRDGATLYDHGSAYKDIEAHAYNYALGVGMSADDAFVFSRQEAAKARAFRDAGAAYVTHTEGMSFIDMLQRVEEAKRAINEDPEYADKELVVAYGHGTLQWAWMVAEEAGAYISQNELNGITGDQARVIADWRDRKADRNEAKVWGPTISGARMDTVDQGHAEQVLSRLPNHIRDYRPEVIVVMGVAFNVKVDLEAPVTRDHLVNRLMELAQGQRVSVLGNSLDANTGLAFKTLDGITHNTTNQTYLVQKGAVDFGEAGIFRTLFIQTAGLWIEPEQATFQANALGARWSNTAAFEREVIEKANQAIQHSLAHSDQAKSFGLPEGVTEIPTKAQLVLRVVERKGEEATPQELVGSGTPGLWNRAIQNIEKLSHEDVVVVTVAVDLENESELREVHELAKRSERVIGLVEHAKVKEALARIHTDQRLFDVVGPGTLVAVDPAITRGGKLVANNNMGTAWVSMYKNQHGENALKGKQAIVHLAMANGKSVALALAQEGVEVLVIDEEQDRLDALVQLAQADRGIDNSRFHVNTAITAQDISRVETFSRSADLFIEAQEHYGPGEDLDMINKMLAAAIVGRLGQNANLQVYSLAFKDDSTPLLERLGKRGVSPDRRTMGQAYVDEINLLHALDILKELMVRKNVSKDAVRDAFISTGARVLTSEAQTGSRWNEARQALYHSFLTGLVFFSSAFLSTAHAETPQLSLLGLDQAGQVTTLAVSVEGQNITFNADSENVADFTTTVRGARTSYQSRRSKNVEAQREERIQDSLTVQGMVSQIVDESDAAIRVLFPASTPGSQYPRSEVVFDVTHLKGESPEHLVEKFGFLVVAASRVTRLARDRKIDTQIALQGLKTLESRQRSTIETQVARANKQARGSLISLTSQAREEGRVAVLVIPDQPVKTAVNIGVKTDPRGVVNYQLAALMGVAASRATVGQINAKGEVAWQNIAPERIPEPLVGLYSKHSRPTTASEVHSALAGARDTFIGLLLEMPSRLFGKAFEMLRKTRKLLATMA